MPIQFACPQCGNRFKVDERLAGKKGRCNKCDRQFRIPATKPKVAASAAATGMFRLGPASSTAVKPSRNGGLDIASNVGLAPVSHRSLERIAKVDREFLDDGGPGPYKMTKAPELRRDRQRRKNTKPPGAIKEFYWAHIHGLINFLKGLSDFGYLLCIPFITMILIAVILGSREWAVTGATGVVLINVARFYLNLINLAVLPFRESLMQGILFLIPPLTLYYLFKNWKRMKRGAKRLIGPTVQIVLVILAFAFIPVLSSGDAGEGATLRERIRAESNSLKQDIDGEAAKLKTEASQGAKKLSNQVGNELENRGITVDSVTEKVREGTDAVKKAAEDTLNDVQPKVEEPGSDKPADANSPKQPE